jgi:glycine betaine/proline transport system substrate-binding protein
MYTTKKPYTWATVILLSIFLFFTSGFAQAAPKTIVFADAGWDSVQVHNRIAGFIIEHGLGYPIKFVTGETIILVTALIEQKGSEAPNIYMESWTENIQELYDKGIAQGKDPNTDKGIIDLGSNFPNSVQGWYVPRYMVEGDAKRGIKATAPKLKSVFDLPKFWKLFKDPEDPSKGRFHNCIPGWACAEINKLKLKVYGLDKYFTVMEPGSGPALAASMEAAYKRGKSWLGYYWAPTWVLGKLDMVQLEEPEFDNEIFTTTRACSYPAVKCNILVHKRLSEWAPDVVEFLKNYETTLDITNKSLAYMRDNKASTEEAAQWFLQNYQPLWTGWVSPQVANKVKAALK